MSRRRRRRDTCTGAEPRTRTRRTRTRGMRTAALTRTHWWTCLSRWRNPRTGALEDRFAALRHTSAWSPVRRCRSCYRRRRKIHRTRPGLRNNQTPRCVRRCTGTPWTLCRGHWSAHGLASTLRCLRLSHSRTFGRIGLEYAFGLFKSRNLVFNNCFRGLGGLDRRRSLRLGRRRCGFGWLRRNNYGGRLAHRLRHNKPRRLGRLRRNCRYGTRCSCRWFNDRRRNPRGNGGRRRGHGLARSTGHRTRRRKRTWNCGRMCSLLGHGLENISRLGDMRQVDFGLELLCRGRPPRATGSARFGMLREVLLDPLRFVHFDRTGVRLLLCYSDPEENVENRLALDLKLSCQIVDSNLLHSALFPPYCPRPVTLS